MHCEVPTINDKSTHPASLAVVFQQITGSPKRFVRRRDHGTGTGRRYVNYTLKTARWGVNIQTLLQAVNNNDPNQDCSSTRCDKTFPWRREDLSQWNFPGRWIGGRWVAEFKPHPVFLLLERDYARRCAQYNANNTGKVVGRNWVIMCEPFQYRNCLPILASRN